MTDDRIDSAVRAARPVPPASLVQAVLGRARARRRARMAAAVSACVVAAVAVIAILSRSSEPTPKPAPEPALAPVASPPPPPPPIAPESWSDVGALLARLDREHAAEAAACAALPSGVGDSEPARFAVSHERIAYLVPHSLGYLGYTRRDTCYQKLAAKLVVPALPDQLVAMTFSLGLATPPSAAWRDPVAVGRDLVARSEPIRRCQQTGVHNARGGVPSIVVRFDRQGVHLVERSSGCLLQALGELVVPPLPPAVSAFVIVVW